MGINEMSFTAMHELESVALAADDGGVEVEGGR